MTQYNAKTAVMLAVIKEKGRSNSLQWRRELWQDLSVVADDLGPGDGHPQTITGGLGREGPLGT